MKKTLLVLMAATLQYSPYEAHAGVFGSVTKKAAGRVMPKPKPVRAPASKTGTVDTLGKTNTAKAGANVLTEAEMVKYHEILSKMDRDVLNDIRNKYGAYIAPEIMLWAEKTPTAFLDKEAYHKLLRETWPNLSDAKINNIIGHYSNGTLRPYVNINTQVSPNVTAHERLHQLSSPKFEEQFGRHMNEGATGYYSLQIRGDLHLVKYKGLNYPEPRSIYELMWHRAGDEPLAKAYFQGDFKALRQVLDNDLGEGTFEFLSFCLRSKDYKLAKEILQGRWKP